jgi:hypothetical protein
MQFRRMLALSLVLMALTTAALMADDTDLYYVGDEAHSIYFVVLGAPESYQVHVWDNDEATDAQMPFEIRVEWGK